MWCKYVEKVRNPKDRETTVTARALFIAIYAVWTPSITRARMWVSMGVVLLGNVFCGLWINAQISLSLEQVLEYRGSMMSLNSASMNLGSVFGAGIGGYLLLSGDWILIGVSIGALGPLAAAILKLWVIDPVKGTR